MNGLCSSVAAKGSDIRPESDEAANYWNPDFNAKTNAMVCHGIGPTDVKTQAVEEVLGPGPLLDDSGTFTASGLPPGSY